MTPPPPSTNPFSALLDKLNHKLGHVRTFIGVYVNSKGEMKILRDATTGKFAWHPSCASLHTEFLKRLHNHDAEYEKCNFYAIAGMSYINNQLLINGYEKTKVKVTSEMLMVFNAIALNFHKNASIGMFMPIEYNLNKLYEKIKNDPSSLFSALTRAKELVLTQTKPCTSCSTLCHVPDLNDHSDSLPPEALEEIENIKESDKHFCFSCGKTLMINMAKHKMIACADLNKIKRVQSLVVELEQCDLNSLNFDFNKAQSVMQELMANVSKTNMTVVNNDKVMRKEKLAPTNPEANKSDSPSTPPPWMN
jgi:hypothetical protein